MRILIAEDDLTARTILVGLVKKWGYEVVVVNDGQAAWQVLQQPEPPALLVLDWMMPGLDGLDVIRLVREKYSVPPPYIILLTSRDEKGDVISGLESGANDYIKKPFVQEELFARLRVGQRAVELQNRLIETQKVLEHLATHDPLTGILNRRAILELLAKECSRTQRGSKTGKNVGLSIGYFDLDNFKQVNDKHGHQVGDEVLKGVVGVLNSRMRIYDSIGRLGGDEFLVVAPDTEEENGEHLFERLGQAIASCKLQTSAGELSIAVSIGVASVGDNEGLDQFLDSADEAMYRAKRAGRKPEENLGSV